ncbi:MAG TPA: hypothetical protein VHC22_03650 [Pirellulales bacterium]|nr:hypothetical protein [Pirellulales bacterium]
MRGIGSVKAGDAGLVIILAVLGALNYGWAFFPPLGNAWGVLNGGMVVGIVVGALACWAWKRIFAGPA